MVMKINHIRRSKPLLVPPPDNKHLISEEDYAAHMYFYDSVTFAMYNRIRDARSRQSYYYWNNIPYDTKSCNTSNETKSEDINEANFCMSDTSRNEASWEEEKTESEDDHLQFIIEM